MPKKSKSEFKIEDYIPSNKPYEMTISVVENPITFNAKPRLSFDEVDQFIGSVLNTTFAENNVSYLAKDFTIAYQTVKLYTDLILPEDIDKQFDLLCTTDLVTKIIAHNSFNQEQYSKILNMIDEQIAFEEQRILADLKKEAQTIIDAFKGVEQLFAGITPEQVQNIIPALQNGFDERKVVDAVLDKQKKTGGKKSKVIEMKPNADS